MAHSIIRLDKVKATVSGSIVSAIHTADIDNGNVVMVGGLHTGEREVFDVVVPATAKLTTDQIYFVATPEVMYLPTDNGLENFYNKTGDIIRLIEAQPGDIVTITNDAITGTPVVGQYLVPANGSTKLAAAADLTGGTKFAAQVIETTNLGYNKGAATVMRVLKN